MKTAVFLMLSLLAMLAGPISSLPPPEDPDNIQEEKANNNLELPNGLPLEQGNVAKRDISSGMLIDDP